MSEEFFRKICNRLGSNPRDSHRVAISGQVMLGEAQASGLQGAHSYNLSSRPETAPKTLRHPPVHPPARPNPLPAPREVLALLPAPSSLLSLLARPFCKCM